MSAHPDADVAPLGIEDVEVVVVHPRHRLLAANVQPATLRARQHLPHRRLGTGDDHCEDPGEARIAWKVSERDVVLALTSFAVDDRNVVLSGPAT